MIYIKLILMINRMEYYMIDAKNIETSNWLRFINSPNKKKDVNLEAYQYLGEIYYKTVREISVGEELLVW